MLTLRLGLLASSLLGMMALNAFQLDLTSHLVYGSFALVLAFLMAVDGRVQRRWILADSFLLIFLGFFILSFFFAEQPFGFQELSSFVVGVALYFWLRFWKIPDLPYVSLLLGVGTVFSVYGLVDFLWGPGDRLASIFQVREAYSFYPNAAALFLIFILVINVVKWLKSGQRLDLVLLVLNATAFYLTFSRENFLSLFVITLLSFVLLGRLFSWRCVLKKSLLLFFFAVLSMGFAYGLNLTKINPLDLGARLSFEDDAGGRSVSERVEFWKGALEMTADRPWFGVGPGGFEAIYPNYQDHWLVLSEHPHNLFLKLSSESGIPSAAFFAAFLLAIFLPIFYKAWEGRLSLWDWAIFLSGSAFLVHHFLDYHLNFTLLSAIFFIHLGLLANRISESGSRQPVLRWDPIRLLSLVVLSIGVLSMAEGVALFPLYQAKGLAAEKAVIQVENRFLPPIPMSRFDILAGLYLDLGRLDDLKVLAQSALKQYPRYHRVHYYLARLDPQHAPMLLQSNSKNELEYYYLYYAPRVPALQDVEPIRALLKTYTRLLAENAHLTLLSQNPIFAEELFLLYPEELQQEYREFLLIWERERLKFEARYGSPHRDSEPGKI